MCGIIYLWWLATISTLPTTLCRQLYGLINLDAVVRLVCQPLVSRSRMNFQSKYLIQHGQEKLKFILDNFICLGKLFDRIQSSTAAAKWTEW